MNKNRLIKNSSPAIALLAFLSLGFVSSVSASDYAPLVGRGSSSFDSVFSPQAGAANSILAVDSSAKQVMLVSSVGQNTNLRWRTFLPPGTVIFEASLFTFSNAVETRTAGRFATPPVSIASQVTQSASDSFLRSNALAKLLNGEELLYFSPLITFADGSQAGSGSMRLSARSEGLAQPTPSTKGGWAYFNTLQAPGDFVKSLDVRVTVDEACYRSWFANAQFDAAGNPAEDVVHTCAGSSGGIPLTGISLSGTSLVKGTSGTITITPQPSAASTGSCSPVYGAGASNLISISGGVISLASGSNSLTTSQAVTIQCGASVSAVITIEPTSVVLTGISLSESSLKKGSSDTVIISPTPSNAILPPCTVGNEFGTTSQVKVTGNAISNNPASSSISANLSFTVFCGTQKATLTLLAPIKVVEGGSDSQLTLDIDLVPNASEVGSPGKVWIAARIPASGFFFPSDMWFFKIKDAGWKDVLLLPNPDSFKFTDLPALTERQVVVVDLGIPKSDLKAFGIEIFMGYRTNTGLFKSVGKVWP